MSDDIGYNDGITAFEDWYRKLSIAIDKHNAWVDAYTTWVIGPRTTAPPVPVKFPKIPLEGPNFNEADKSTWPWPRKFFRNTMRKLKDYYDAVNPSNGGGDPDPPPPPPPPPLQPWDSGFAPQSYNQGGSGQDARYNIRINCTQRSDGKYVDGQGVVYDDGGRPLGGRTQTAIPELKPADQMDGREPWDIYIYNDVQIGPNKENYPAASYNR